MDVYSMSPCNSSLCRLYILDEVDTLKNTRGWSNRRRRSGFHVKRMKSCSISMWKALLNDLFPTCIHFWYQDAARWHIIIYNKYFIRHFSITYFYLRCIFVPWESYLSNNSNILHNRETMIPHNIILNRNTLYRCTLF